MSKMKQQDDKEKIGTILDKSIVKKIKDRSDKKVGLSVKSYRMQFLSMMNLNRLSLSCG